jgi:adenylate cyclase
MAEVELESEDEAVMLPPWVTKEVSGDKRYFNANLRVNPYTNWNRRQ